MKHTFEEKLNYVSLILKGEPQSQICRRYKLGQHYLENLIDRYKLYGEAGLRQKSYNAISPENKERLVRLFEENGLTLRQICNQYSVSKTAFESWVRQVRSRGYESLYEMQRRGRPPKNAMARPKKKEPHALERANCLPENAVMIGDRLDNDILPAKRVGLKTIWIRQGFGGMGTPAAEEEIPDCFVNNLQELLELLI